MIAENEALLAAVCFVSGTARRTMDGGIGLTDGRTDGRTDGLTDRQHSNHAERA